MKENDMKNTLAEGEKPKIVKNLEDCFPGLLWDPDRQFNIGDNDIYLLFDAINDGLFQNKLGRDIPKFTLKAELIPEGYVLYAAAFFGYPGPAVKDRGERKGTVLICRYKQNRDHRVRGGRHGGAASGRRDA